MHGDCHLSGRSHAPVESRLRRWQQAGSWEPDKLGMDSIGSVVCGWHRVRLAMWKAQKLAYHTSSQMWSNGNDDPNQPHRGDPLTCFISSWRRTFSSSSQTPQVSCRASRLTVSDTNKPQSDYKLGALRTETIETGNFLAFFRRKWIRSPSSRGFGSSAGESMFCLAEGKLA